jgi:hypothetical protein
MFGIFCYCPLYYPGQEQWINGTHLESSPNCAKSEVRFPVEIAEQHAEFPE